MKKQMHSSLHYGGYFIYYYIWRLVLTIDYVDDIYEPYISAAKIP